MGKEVGKGRKRRWREGGGGREREKSMTILLDKLKAELDINYLLALHVPLVL
jgi:hypothetical protein